METQFGLRAVGRVESAVTDPASAAKQGHEGGVRARVVFFPEYAPALKGLHPGDQVVLVTWLHLSGRAHLEVHPRGDPSREKRGVFSTRSPDRPNPLGLHRVGILDMGQGPEGPWLEVAPLEAVDKTPVVDVKTVMRGEVRALPADAERIAHAALPVLAEAGKRLWDRGLVSGFNSNLSLMVEHKVVLTCSGASKGSLGVEDICVLDPEDARLLGGGRPSTEAAMHLEVYRQRPRTRAVVHCHPPNLLALRLAYPEALLLELPLYEAGIFRSQLAVVGPLEPGSDDLARSVGQAAAGSACVFLENHGLVCRGDAMPQALGLCEEIESLARIQFMALTRPEGK
jgi:L-fuculose-phosphate aldolase